MEHKYNIIMFVIQHLLTKCSPRATVDRTENKKLELFC